MTSVAILEIGGCLASSAALSHDMLATANRLAPSGRAPFQVRAVQCGPRRASGDLHGADLVIVPGLGMPAVDDLAGTLAGAACRRAGGMLVDAHSRGAALAASCASTFVLAQAGLLDGRRATTSWWLAPQFRQRYPQVELVPEQVVVADWPIATGGAALAHMDLMLAVVARFASPAVAKTCARFLLLDERRSQAPFMAVTYLAGQDPALAKAETWVRQHIARDFAMEELAAAVALGPRTFARRLAATCGLSPIQFVQRIRLETAQHLLATTRLPLEQIAQSVGYADASTLRRLIRRDTQRTPAHFRSAR
ncbi:GlxA family transcriptional regulator [Xenophilus sp. Marseille-Q4582]|uniref:GlxA family transcriptional regulator n=1 Tax=Xenophilus sp. Marseille-Q4582 TaxID=2866600 RepID=UPI001CE4A90B|nr:helix-turn-helix domain-containing protein [Xenophilus sp. Marseille-Q4582]